MEELKQAKADALGQVAALEGEVARFQVIRFFFVKVFYLCLWTDAS